FATAAAGAALALHDALPISARQTVRRKASERQREGDGQDEKNGKAYVYGPVCPGITKEARNGRSGDEPRKADHRDDCDQNDRLRDRKSTRLNSSHVKNSYDD